MDVEGADLAQVTAVILIWNSRELGIRTLGSLEGAFAAGMRMVMLDNGSVDGSYEAIRDFVDDWAFAGSVEMVRSDENLGFCGGVNLGVDRALAAGPGPRFILMLNPDAEVTVDTVRELVAVAKESGCEIVAPGGPFLRFDQSSRTWPRSFWWPRRPARREPAPRWWVGDSYQGACVLIECSLIRELIRFEGHFLDPRLFMYWDERDLLLRAESMGATVALSRDAAVSHKGGEVNGRSPVARARQYYLARNAILVARRHLPAHQFAWMLPLHLFRDFAWMGRQRLDGSQPNVSAYLEGVMDGLRGRAGIWKNHPQSPAKR